MQALGDMFVQGLCIASWLFMKNVLYPWLLVKLFSMSNIRRESQEYFERYVFSSIVYAPVPIRQFLFAVFSAE